MLLKTLLNSMYFSGLQSALKPYLGGMGAILMLHRVQNIRSQEFEPNSHLTISPQFLDTLILDLKVQGYEFISMDEASERLASPEKYSGKKPFLSITLDDGYRDNLENAVPVFQRHNVPYMIYIAAGLTEARAPLWWEDLQHIIASKKTLIVDMPEGREHFKIDTIKQKHSVYEELLHRFLMQPDQVEHRKIVNQICKSYGFDQLGHVKSSIMNWEELRSLSKDPLCSFGAHTIHHYATAMLSPQMARDEMEESRAALKKNIGYDALHFSYPYGMKEVAGQREFDLVKDLGFLTATTTRHGVLYPEHNEHLFALPRISLNGNFQSMRYVNALISGLPTRLKNKGKKLNVA